MDRMKVPLIAALLILHWMPLQGQQQNSKVKSLKITILSTMLADEGIGEWGFSALVEVDGRKILFDTGARPETVLSNIKDLKIDLSDVTEIFISHNHQDHTGGLLRLREELGKKNPGALSVAHAGEGIFYPRVGAKGNTSYILESKPKFEAMGGKFEIHHEPKEGADFLLSQVSGENQLMCASAGNFGQAMAFACRKEKVKLIVYASINANPYKIERMRSLGAEVVLATIICGGNLTETQIKDLLA